MSKLKDLIESIRNRKKPDLENETESEDITNQPEPKVTRINKKIIYIAVGFIAVFVLSTVFFSNAFSDQADKDKKGNQNVEVAPKSKGATGATSYSELAQYENQNRDKNLKQVPGQSINPQNPQQAANVNRYSQSLPQIRASNGNSGYYSPPPSIQNPYLQSMQQAAQIYAAQQKPSVTSPVPVTTQVASQPATEKDTYSAAISFNLGLDTGNTGANSNYGIYTEATENTLDAGTLIPAVIMSGINTDLPGQVVAQVQNDVYDSLTGSTILIPQGSRIVGDYSSDVNNGQSRINVSWQTILLPDGRSFSLGDTCIAVGDDGYVGIAGNVNNHTNKILGSTLLTSALGALSSIATGNNASNNGWNNSNSFSQGAASGLISTADKFLEKNMNISATITVDPGTTFNIMVSKPLYMEAY